MAITKILTINDCGRTFAAKHLKQAISYIIDEAKTQGGRYVTGVNCQPELACEQMIKTKIGFIISVPLFIPLFFAYIL